MSQTFKYSLTKTLKNYVLFIPQLTKPILRALIQVSVHYIESRYCSPEVLELALTKLSHTGCEIPENVYELYAAILSLMQLFLRTPKGSVKDDVLRECLRDLRFTDDCIDDISKVLHNHRHTLSQNYSEAKNMRAPARRIQWCINLSLIESGISRAAQPSIVLHLQLKNGKFVTFDVPFSAFHQLRFAVASLLREIQAFEGRSIGFSKIDDVDKRVT